MTLNLYKPTQFEIYTEEYLIETKRHKPDTSGITKQLTGRIRETYWHVNPINYSFYTEEEINILTDETEKVTNSGFDNSNYDLIVSEGDIIGSATSYEGRYYSANPETISRYKIIKKLGNGMFGQVFKAIDLTKNKEVALKVLKSKTGYFRQGMLEAIILSMLNDIYDVDGTKHSVRMYDHFLYCNHLCIVFELLGQNLYEVICENDYTGFNIMTVRKMMTQLLQCLDMLFDAHIVHCDIKPENLILDPQTNGIKIIDFGSACFDNYTLYTYVQSRHYRAPEIILGIPYNNSIDMWSAGCIAAELVIGIPLFPGSSEFNQLFKITDMLGKIPNELLAQGKKTSSYFNRLGSGENVKYIMKQPFEYEIENGIRLEPNKKYFKFKTLRELIMRIPLQIGGGAKEDITMISEMKLSLLHFIEGMLEYDPMKRWTPAQALQHPFITGRPFTSTWQPPYFCSQPRQPFKKQTITMSSNEFAKKCFGNDIQINGLTAAEYYDICTTSLQMGEVVNITCSNPFQLGPMTPESFRTIFESMKNGQHCLLPYQGRITRRKSSLRRENNPHRSQLKTSQLARKNAQSPMKIIQSISGNGSDEFLGGSIQPQRKRFESWNAGVKHAPVADYKLVNKLDFDPKDIGSVKLENSYVDVRTRKDAIVQEPSNVNIPIVPIPIRSETTEEQFEFAPLFIFGK